MQTRILLATTAAALGLSTVSCNCVQCPDGQPTEAEILTATDPEHPYVVCERSYEDPHLALDDEVLIGAVDLVTSVSLGSRTLDMIRTDRGRELTMLVDFMHQDSPQTHVVRIRKALRYQPPADPKAPRCDPKKNIIRISFCYRGQDKNENLTWFCPETPPPGYHGGDTHAQS